MAGKWNPATKKMEFPKGEKAGVADTSNDVYVVIPKSTINELAKLALKDGAEVVKATTDRGQQAQNTRLARPYILAVIQDFLNSRKGS